MVVNEEFVEKWFKRRFPDKDLEFEKKCGYFGEWIERFKSGYPERYMDSLSLSVYNHLLKEMGLKRLP